MTVQDAFCADDIDIDTKSYWPKDQRSDFPAGTKHDRPAILLLQGDHAVTLNALYQCLPHRHFRISSFFASDNLKVASFVL